MAFVFEQLGSVEAQEIRNLVRDPVYAFQDRVMIDRERDLVFVDLGGHGDQPKGEGECPTYYNLLWKKIPIVFEGYDSFKTIDGVLTREVSLTTLIVSKIFEDIVPEIQEGIVEAMNGYWSGRYRRTISANVQFPTVQFY